ncbi:MAG TPA: glycerate kinase [Chloroflexota bacterium]|nr:glycerate kinase [Chloroflexota bacterium]
MSLRIVVAPQSFKGSLEATEVARAIARGVRRVFPGADLDLVPVADGGEGTVRALVGASGGRTVTTRVVGPLERPVTATWGLLGGDRVAVIEMAAASGLPLLGRHERNPARATSFGTGQLILQALDYGVERIIVGIGGSATNDGGAGMAQALGVRFLDGEGRELPRGGAALLRLARIDVSGLDPRLAGVTVEAACDVANPLCGPEGASYVYGPQKGADPDMVRMLDAALHRYAEIIQRDLGKDVAGIPGSGAAGGLGAGLIAFLNATLEPGVDIVFRAIRLADRLRGADVVITGEGRMDQQDLYGKAPLAVAQLADSLGVPSIAIVGSTGRDYHVVYQHGIDAVIGTVNRPMTLDRAIGESSKLVSEAAMRAARLLKVGMEIRRNGGENGSILS